MGKKLRTIGFVVGGLIVSWLLALLTKALTENVHLSVHTIAVIMFFGILAFIFGPSFFFGRRK